MKIEVTATVLSVSRQWWLKINTRPLRISGAHGAIYPHVIKLRYCVGGKEYTTRKWIPAGEPVPSIGSHIDLLVNKK